MRSVPASFSSAAASIALSWSTEKLSAGSRRSGAPQVARHGPHVAASRDHRGGEGVPGVVEGALEGVHLAEGGEVLAELRGVVGPAPLLPRPQYVGVAGGKRELVGDAPGVRPHQAQHVEGAPGEGDGPQRARGLRLLHVEAAGSVPQGVAHGYGAAAREVGPPERACLAAPHARGEGYLHREAQGLRLSLHGEAQRARAPERLGRILRYGRLLGISYRSLKVVASIRGMHVS